MTIEEIIYHVLDCTGGHSEQLPPRIGLAVVKLIEAGQAMYDDKVTDIISVQGRCDSSDHTPAMEAWDAALGEKE